MKNEMEPADVKPVKLENRDLRAIAADPYASTAPLSIVRLLGYVQWLNDELERVSEGRDRLRDARDSGTLGSRSAARMLTAIHRVLDLPLDHDPVAAVRELKAQRDQLLAERANPPNLTLTQIHKLLDFIKNAAHVYYASNGGKIDHIPPVRLEG